MCKARSGALLAACPPPARAALPSAWHRGPPEAFSLRTSSSLLRPNGAPPVLSNSPSATETSPRERGRRTGPAAKVLRAASLCPCRGEDAKSPQKRRCLASAPSCPGKQTLPLPTVLPSSQPLPGHFSPLSCVRPPHTRLTVPGPAAAQARTENGWHQGSAEGRALGPHLPSIPRSPPRPSARNHAGQRAQRRQRQRQKQLLRPTAEQPAPRCIPETLTSQHPTPSLARRTYISQSRAGILPPGCQCADQCAVETRSCRGALSQSASRSRTGGGAQPIRSCGGPEGAKLRRGAG